MVLAFHEMTLGWARVFSAKRHFESCGSVRRRLPGDGFCLEWGFVLVCSFHFDRQRGTDTRIADAVEQTTPQSTLIQNWLVTGFMSFRKTIKPLPVLDLNDVLLSWRRNKSTSLFFCRWSLRWQWMQLWERRRSLSQMTRFPSRSCEFTPFRA